MATLPHEHTVESIMSRSPVTVSLDTPLWQVRELMRTGGFHHAVVTEGEQAVGVVSDRDVLAALSPSADRARVARESDLATLTKRVHQLMSRGLVTASRETPIVEAGEKMLRHRIHCLPVLDPERRCVGIVTVSDVLAWSLDRLALPAVTDAAA